MATTLGIKTLRSKTDIMKLYKPILIWWLKRKYFQISKQKQLNRKNTCCNDPQQINSIHNAQSFFVRKVKWNIGFNPDSGVWLPCGTWKSELSYRHSHSFSSGGHWEGSHAQYRRRNESPGEYSVAGKRELLPHWPGVSYEQVHWNVVTLYLDVL